MDKFNMLLNEVVAKPEKTNALGSRIGEIRDIRIKYAVGDEEHPEIGLPVDSDPEKRKEDGAALLYAAGKVLAQMLDADEKEIGDGLVAASIEIILEHYEKLFDKIKEDLLK